MFTSLLKYDEDSHRLNQNYIDTPCLGFKFNAFMKPIIRLKDRIHFRICKKNIVGFNYFYFPKPLIILEFLLFV